MLRSSPRLMLRNNDGLHRLVVVLTMAALFSAAVVVEALPIQMTINYRATECLYDEFKEGESLTMSLFILSGQELRARAFVDGPHVLQDHHGEKEIVSGKDLQQAVDTFDGARSKRKTLIFNAEVDFEHLKLDEEPEEEEEEEYTEEGEDSVEARRARRAKERKKVLEQRQRQENHKHRQKKYVREEGEPFQKTFQVPTTGWYRFCVTAEWFMVTAELDLRKESDYGGLGEGGHVFTLEEKALNQEEKLMEEDTASQEGIKDEDFKSTREKLKTLRRLLADIQSKQNMERHRLIVHAATNEHSRSRMVLSSLFETILFMVVTGFQVYTIRRWFKGAPVLGR